MLLLPPAGADAPPAVRLPVLAQTLGFWFAPETFLHRARARHGDVFRISVRPAGEALVIADPALIKEVFAGSNEVFRAGQANAILGPVLGARSVLLLDGAEHLAERKRLLPSFHGEHVRRLVGVMREVAEAEVASWPLGRSFALHPRMHRLTLEIILRTVFGVQEEARLRELRRLLPRLTDLKPWLLAMWEHPGLARVPPWRRWVDLKREVDALLHDEIARRRTVPDLAERPDVLSMLVRGGEHDDEEIRDELMTLLLAGHETTATLLAWLFERVPRHPAVAERLRDAVREGDDGYVDAVVKETLRVRPVINRVGRRTAAPVTLGGHDLPAGTLLLPAIGLVQLDAAHHADPRAFRPERWLDGAEPVAPYTWLPFGGGVRRCLGATFALVEAREIVRAVVTRLELTAEGPSERQRARHITIAPWRGARVTARTA